MCGDHVDVFVSRVEVNSAGRNAAVVVSIASETHSPGYIQSRSVESVVRPIRIETTTVKICNRQVHVVGCWLVD